MLKELLWWQSFVIKYTYEHIQLGIYTECFAILSNWWTIRKEVDYEWRRKR